MNNCNHQSPTASLSESHANCSGWCLNTCHSLCVVYVTENPTELFLSLIPSPQTKVCGSERYKSIVIRVFFHSSTLYEVQFPPSTTLFFLFFSPCKFLSQVAPAPTPSSRRDFETYERNKFDLRHVMERVHYPEYAT